MLDAASYEFGDDAQDAFRSYLELRVTQPLFAHARSVRNGLERARLRQANRVYAGVRAGRAPTRSQLVRIEEQDILKSSVFNAETGS
jgi:hypothetical protein